MPPTAGAVRGATFPRSAQRQPPGAPSAERAPDGRPPAPRRGTPRQAGPRVRTRDGQVQELFGATPSMPLPGQRVLGEEGGPSVGQGVEVTPPRRERRASAPPENETLEGPVTGMGELEVEGQLGAEAGGGGDGEEGLSAERE